MNVADPWKIEGVLALVKRTSLERLHVSGLARPESKTFRFVTSLGYTVKDIHKCLMGLSLSDYAAGPLCDDKGRPRDLWVFGKPVEGVEAYIKLAVYASGDNVYTICVSFHEAEWPLAHPFKEA